MPQLTISPTVQQQLQKFIGQKELKDEYGQRVVALASLQASAVTAKFLEILQQRNIPLVTLQHFSSSENEFIVLKKVFKQGEEAATAVRIESFGNDLVIETRQYEWSASKNASYKLWGTILTPIGVLFVWTGVGAIVMFIGIACLITHPRLSGSASEEAGAFRKAVRECISMALTNLGIES
jgi:hypothetical protein